VIPKPFSPGGRVASGQIFGPVVPSQDSQGNLNLLTQWLCDNRKLFGRPTERARVAFRVNFFIRREFQNARLATHICGKEESYFRIWGAREIHVVAMEMGRWVWTRPHFGYQIPAFDFESTQEKYKEWQRARGISPAARAARLSDFPRDFLLNDEVGSLTLYKAL
jgi:hypothetical protein